MSDIPTKIEPVNEELLQKQIANEDLNMFIREKFDFAADARKSYTEFKWLTAVRNWRAEYSPDQLQKIAQASLRNPNSSATFIGKTRVKVQAAYGQLTEVLFSSNKIPISIEPTPIPEGIAETVFLEPEGGPLQSDVGFAGDDLEIPKGATQSSLLGGLTQKIGSLIGNRKVVEGNSPSPELPELHPAAQAAMNMEKLMQDQLRASNTEFAIRRVVLDCVILGTGVLKGPFNSIETKHKWKINEETGINEYDPVDFLTPRFDTVSPWNFYPDPDAINQNDMSYVVERHLMSRVALRSLKNKPGFNSESIDSVLRLDPMSEMEDWEQSIRDNSNVTSKRRYEVLEYWGWIDEELAQRLNLEFDQDSELIVNAWVSNGEILKVIVNPFIPQRIPYQVVPYEEHPEQLWGIGVPENMADSQKDMNGHMRMAIDNLKLAGNVVFEVNENFLVPGQDMTVYPGKIWRKQGGAPGQAIFATKFPDTSQSHMIMFDKMSQLADEQTGIPSSSHGQGPVSRTAAVASMMASGAALSIKTVIKNIDNYLLRPCGENLFSWNMQFNDDSPEIRGDINIIARGSSALLQREVKSQRLLSYLQITQGNPLVNQEYLLQELAKSMDLDPDKSVNDPVTARLYAELIQLQGAQNETDQGAGGQAGSPSPSQGGVEGTGGSSNPAELTGSGNGQIGVGGVPQGGENQFAG